MQIPYSYERVSRNIVISLLDAIQMKLVILEKKLVSSLGNNEVW